MRLLFPFFFAGLLIAADPITDEPTRLQALSTVFHGMFVKYAPGQSVDASRTIQSRHPLLFPDAFAGEKVYEVAGLPMNSSEKCAAENEPPSKSWNIRELRFRVYPWPVGGPTEQLVIAQYRFPKAKPSRSCPSIALLAHLSGEGKEQELLEARSLDTWSHTALQSIQLVDVTGDGYADLVIESDSGDSTQTSTQVNIFDLSEARFEQLFTGPTRWHSEPADEGAWTQLLDVPRTVREQGKRFCFEKTIYGQSGKWFPTPRVSRPCYAKKDSSKEQ